MWEELKQKREEKKQNMQENFHTWKEDIKERYGKRFPKPKLDKPTTNLSEANQDDISNQSTKTTKIILKFWLI
jgi:hypothetical protein